MQDLAYRGAVVVTGGAGFLGAEVIRQLVELGCSDIRSVDLNPYKGPFRQQTRSFVADIRHDDLDGAFADAGTVLHLAACQYHTPIAPTTYSLPFFPVNVDGTRRVLQAAKRARAKRFVFVSTNMIYGLPQSLPLAETHAKTPFGPYGKSKLAAEKLVEEAHRGGLDASIVRPGLIVGPGRGGVMERIFDWIVANRPVTIIGNGSNRYEIMASEDVASLILAVGRTTGFRAYNAAAKDVPTMRTWIGSVIAKAGSRSRVIGLPGRLVKLGMRTLETVHLAPLRKDQYLIADIDYYMDASLARRELGWVPKWSGIDAALATFDWYKSLRGASSGETLAS